MVDFPLDLNMTNFTHQPIRYGLVAYNKIFGEFTLAIIFLFIGWGIYVGTDRDLNITAAYFLAVAVIFGVILNFYLLSLLLLICGIIVTLTIVKRFLE